MATKPSGPVPIHSSIPHKGVITQPTLSRRSRKSGKNKASYLTRTQQEAFWLYDLGLNVFPQPIGKKSGHPWKRLQYTRLHRDHHRFGLYSLFAGKCNIAIICGRTSGDLFVIDCETNKSFEYNILQMRLRDIPIWAVKTARGGHIYLRSNNGEVSNIAAGVMPDVEIRGRRTYVITSPSTHPSGARYEWLATEGENIPAVDPNTIDWLTDNNGNHLTLKTTPHEPQVSSFGPIKLEYTPKGQTKLSNTTNDYLTNGHTIPEGSRNNRLFQAACDLSGNGYSYDTAIHKLLPIAKGSGLPDREIITTVKSAYSQPRTPSKPTKNPQETPIWKIALEYTLQTNWMERTGNSQRKMMLALIKRARQGENQGVFRASVRELCTIGKMGSATAQRILKKLQEDKLIIKCGSDKTSQATLWKFGDRIKKDIQEKPDTLPPPKWKIDSVSVFYSTDLVEHGALGYVGVSLYHAMAYLNRPVMPKDLAEFTGLKVHQVHYVLKKLRRYGLIARFDRGWMVIKELDAAVIGEILSISNVEGRSERRIARFMGERQLFVSRILFMVRLRREGRAFLYAGAFVERVPLLKGRFPSLAKTFLAMIDALIEDKTGLIALGLDLGAEVEFAGDPGRL